MKARVRTDILAALIFSSTVCAIVEHMLMFFFAIYVCGELTTVRWSKLLQEQDRLKLFVPGLFFAVLLAVSVSFLAALMRTNMTTLLMAPVLGYFIALFLSAYANKTWTSTYFEHLKKNPSDQESNDA